MIDAGITQKGHKGLDEVDIGILESCGGFSVLRKRRMNSHRKGLGTKTTEAAVGLNHPTP